MAIVKAPALSLDASGNLGGICFSSWRGLSIARDVWTGTVPNTPDQVVIQGYMKTVSKAWSGTLTETQRELWRDAAKEQVRVSRVNTKYTPTGYQYFMQINMQVKRQAFPLLMTPPPKMEPYGFGSITVVWQATLVRFAILARESFDVVPTTVQGEFWKAGPYDNAGRHPIDPEYKFLSYATIATGKRDSNVVLLKYYWYRVRWVERSGRVGNWFEKQGYSG